MTPYPDDRLETDTERLEHAHDMDLARQDRRSDYAPADWAYVDALAAEARELFPFADEPFGFTKHQVAERELLAGEGEAA